MLILIGSAGALYLSTGAAVDGLRSVMAACFTLIATAPAQEQVLIGVLGTAVANGFIAFLPFFALAILIALFGPALLGGWAWSGSGVVPKFSKVDPIKGFKRLFSLNSVVETLKSVAKFLLVLLCAIVALRLELKEVMNLAVINVDVGMARGLEICGRSFLLIASATIVIALVDVPFQLWDHGRKLRMTKTEVRDELKQHEGSPETRGRIRNLQLEMAQRRMMEEVPQADVVITNPTHYAVALRFDETAMAAPRLVAKGPDLVAFRIREIAQHYGVSVVAAPHLARALYFTTKLNGEIPAGLYVAVAQVLAYVYQLKRHGAGTPPVVLPRDLPIPPEYQF